MPATTASELSAARLDDASALREEALQDLVGRAQNGDAEAFGMIYRHYQADVDRYVARRVRDVELAQDLTQQVFLKAWQALPRYQERGRPLLAWLYTIARNQLIDHARASRDTQGLEEIELPDGGRSVEEEVLESANERSLQAALGRLSDDYREVLILRFWLEKPAAEVGALMGRSAGAVRVLQLRAVKALRRELKAEGLTG